MNLVSMIGWISSKRGKPLYYSNSTLTTSQDYIKSKPINIWLYDRAHKKRRQVTLRIPSEERDSKKTATATFANFIHQNDAYIAMEFIKEMDERNIPIYTVHDNFITSGININLLGKIYINILCKTYQSPIAIVNFFITRNLAMNKTVPINYNLAFADEIESILKNTKPQN